MAEWNIYCKTLENHPGSGDNFDVKKFWASASIRVPKLAKIAKAVLNIPVNSVDAERSFSVLAAITVPPRSSLSTESLKIYNDFAFN